MRSPSDWGLLSRLSRGLAAGVSRTWRQRLARHATLLIIVCSLVAVAGLGAGVWGLTNPDTTSTTTTLDETTVEQTVETSAVTIKDTRLYPAGHRVRNAPIYFRGSMPEATIHTTTDVAKAIAPATSGSSSAAAENASMTVTHRTELVLSVDHAGTVYWQDTIALDNQTTTTAVPATGANEPVTTTTTLAVQTILEHLAEVEETVGGHSSVSADLRVETVYDTPRYEDSLTQTLPVSVGDQTYSFDDGQTQTTTTETTTNTTDTTTVPLWAWGALVSGLLGLGGALVVWAVRRTTPLSYPSWKRTLDVYREWWSDGHLTAAGPRHTYEVTDVAAIVDAAMDADRRVIYDETKGVCAVTVQDTLYYWTVPESDWSPDTDDDITIRRD